MQINKENDWFWCNLTEQVAGKIKSTSNTSISSEMAKKKKKQLTKQTTP